VHNSLEVKEYLVKAKLRSASNVPDALYACINKVRVNPSYRQLYAYMKTARVSPGVFPRVTIIRRHALWRRDSTDRR